MKYKHLQLIIAVLSLLLIPINTYYDGNILVTISMFLIAFGMGIQAFSLYDQEKKTGPKYVKTIINIDTFIFLFLVLALGGIGFFGAKNWWGPLVVSLILSFLFGIVWFLRTNK